MNYFVVSLVHIYLMRYHLIWPSSAKYFSNRLQFWRVWQQKFVLLYMFVKWQHFCLWGRVVGLEEVVVEMVPINRYVENKTNAAHKFLNNYILIILCLPVFIKEFILQSLLTILRGQNNQLYLLCYIFL
jgi:hypothetical protein